MADVNNKTYIPTPPPPAPTIYYGYGPMSKSDINNNTFTKHIISNTLEKDDIYKIVLDETFVEFPTRFYYNNMLLGYISFENFEEFTIIPDNFIVSCSGIIKIDLSGLSNVQTIGNNFLSYNGSRFTEVDLSPLTKVTSIGNEFLAGCGNLETLTMPNTTGITSIGTKYLNQCFKLTKIYCPKGTLEKYKQLMPDSASKMVELS